MGNQKQPTNQPSHPLTNVPPTNDQPSQPTWSISYTNGTEKLDVSFQGEAGQVWNAGTQSTMRALIEKMNAPVQPSRAWIEPSAQPAYYQQPPSAMPALLPSPTSAPLMLAPAQDSLPQTPNENFTPQPIYQPAPTSITVFPTPVPTVNSPSASPTGSAVVRPGVSKQALEVWGGRAAMVANVGAGVFLFYLIVFYGPTRTNIWNPLWNYLFPAKSVVEQTQPAKPNVQPTK